MVVASGRRKKQLKKVLQFPELLEVPEIAKLLKVPEFQKVLKVPKMPILQLQRRRPRRHHLRRWARNGKTGGGTFAGRRPPTNESKLKLFLARKAAYYTEKAAHLQEFPVVPFMKEREYWNKQQALDASRPKAKSKTTRSIKKPAAATAQVKQESAGDDDVHDDLDWGSFRSSARAGSRK